MTRSHDSSMPQTGTQPGQSPASFTLSSMMTIDTIEAVAEDVKKISFGEKSVCTFDMRQVESITTPGLQLIVAAEKTLAASGGTLKVIGHRDAVTRVFRDAGLEAQLTKITTTEAANG